MEFPLPCFVCGREMISATPLLNEEAPSLSSGPLEGLHFTSPGNYGSTIWDPCGPFCLEINVCDSCVREGQDRVVTVHVDVSKKKVERTLRAGIVDPADWKED